MQPFTVLRFSANTTLPLAIGVAWFAWLPLLGGGAAAQEPHPGQAPYDRVCKVCHGPDGEGNAGPALVPFTMELEELLIKVREGGGEMPPISANRVSDEEVKQIAEYLISLTPENERRH